MNDVSLLRLARRRPLLFALFETLLTGGCTLLWYMFAGLLSLENQSYETGNPDVPEARPFVLLAYAFALSLPLTWALRGIPVLPLRRIVDRVVLPARAVAMIAVSLGALAFAVVS